MLQEKMYYILKYLVSRVNKKSHFYSRSCCLIFFTSFQLMQTACQLFGDLKTQFKVEAGYVISKINIQNVF